MQRFMFLLPTIFAFVLVGCHDLQVPHREQPATGAAPPPPPPPPPPAPLLPDPEPEPPPLLQAEQSRKLPEFAEQLFAADALSRATIDHCVELAELLATIEDAAAAQRAAPAVASLARKLRELQEQVLRSANNLPADKDWELHNAYSERLRNAAGRVTAELRRLQHLPGAEPLLAAIANPESVGEP